MKIFKYPDPVLKQECSPVEDFGEDLGRLIDDMLETMYAGGGVGLAAPQVGLTRRLLVADVSRKGDSPVEAVNPRIIFQEGSVAGEEGCLSLPDYREIIRRAKRVRVAAQNRRGEPIEIEAEDFMARCLQHEIDHLDGILCIDRLSRIKKQLFRDWYRKRGPFE